MIPPDSKIGKNPKVVHHDLDEGQRVLLHLESGAYYGLNRTGTLIWSLIDGTRTLAEVLTEFRGLVENAPSSIEEDMSAFLEDLRKRDLVQLT